MRTRLLAGLAGVAVILELLLAVSTVGLALGVVLAVIMLVALVATALI